MKAILKSVGAGCLFVALLMGEARAEVRTFTVDAAAKGSVLPNVVQMLTSWNLPKEVGPQTLAQLEWDVRAFAEWVEVMAATGGDADRDCFRAPMDRSVTDDYDFTKLVAGCRAIRALGLKPYLKLGNVPAKLSSSISNGDFAMNVRPPDDFAVFSRRERRVSPSTSSYRPHGRGALSRLRGRKLTMRRTGSTNGGPTVRGSASATTRSTGRPTIRAPCPSRVLSARPTASASWRNSSRVIALAPG